MTASLLTTVNCNANGAAALCNVNEDASDVDDGDGKEGNTERLRTDAATFKRLCSSGEVRGGEGIDAAEEDAGDDPDCSWLSSRTAVSIQLPPHIHCSANAAHAMPRVHMHVHAQERPPPGMRRRYPDRVHASMWLIYTAWRSEDAASVAGIPMALLDRLSKRFDEAAKCMYKDHGLTRSYVQNSLRKLHKRKRTTPQQKRYQQTAEAVIADPSLCTTLLQEYANA